MWLEKRSHRCQTTYCHESRLGKREVDENEQFIEKIQRMHKEENRTVIGERPDQILK